MWPKTDGKLLIAARDPQAPSAEVIKLSRLTSLGAVDSSFHPQLPPNFTLLTAAAQNDDSILVAGRDNNDPASLQLLRLLADGAFDPSFHAELDTSTNLNWSVLILPGAYGKIWVRGFFTNVNGVERPLLARLNRDGSLDSAFALKTNADFVGRIAIQGDNLLLEADFVRGDAGTMKFLRALPDGSIDSSFTASSIPDGFVVDDAGRILVSGFQLRPPDTRVIFWRLLPDGAIDPDFQEVASDGDINSVALQPDGKMIVAGFFEVLNGVPRRSLARLNPNGTVDLTFDPGPWQPATPYVYGVVLQTDGRAIVASDVDLAPEADLLRFWGDEYLRLGRPARNFNGPAIFSVTNTLEAAWVLESSVDLISWQPLSTNGVSATQSQDSNAVEGHKFYRGVVK